MPSSLDFVKDSTREFILRAKHEPENKFTDLLSTMINCYSCLLSEFICGVTENFVIRVFQILLIIRLNFINDIRSIYLMDYLSCYLLRVLQYYQY